jgi:hypothetical protein
MPCFAMVSGMHVVCSEITDCGKSEQNRACCYYLLVVKLVVKGKGLLLRIIYNKAVFLHTALSQIVLSNIQLYTLNPQNHKYTSWLKQ